MCYQTSIFKTKRSCFYVDCIKTCFILSKAYTQALFTFVIYRFYSVRIYNMIFSTSSIPTNLTKLLISSLNAIIQSSL